MAVEARRELHALADQLSDEHVTEVVVFARWLVSKEAAVSLDDLLAMWRQPDERRRD